MTAGYGDLTEQRFNVYLNAEYERDDLISVSDRGFSYNTTDLSSIGGDDNNNGAFGAFGTRATSISAVVRPAVQTVAGNILSGQAVTGGLTQVLTAGGCATGTISRNDSSGAYCEQNAAPYGTIQPQQTRDGFGGHGTFKIGDHAEAYLTGTYYHSSVYSTAAPFTIRQNNPVSTTNIVLAVFLANGQLNPQNPYAQQGLAVQIAYAFGDLPRRIDDDQQRVPRRGRHQRIVRPGPNLFGGCHLRQERPDGCQHRISEHRRPDGRDQ